MNCRPGVRAGKGNGPAGIGRHGDPVISNARSTLNRVGTSEVGCGFGYAVTMETEVDADASQAIASWSEGRLHPGGHAPAIGVEACGPALVVGGSVVVVVVDVEVVAEVLLIDCGTVVRAEPHAASRKAIAT